MLRMAFFFIAFFFVKIIDTHNIRVKLWLIIYKKLWGKNAYLFEWKVNFDFAVYKNKLCSIFWQFKRFCLKYSLLTTLGSLDFFPTKMISSPPFWQMNTHGSIGNVFVSASGRLSKHRYIFFQYLNLFICTSFEKLKYYYLLIIEQKLNNKNKEKSRKREKRTFNNNRNYDCCDKKSFFSKYL